MWLGEALIWLPDSNLGTYKIWSQIRPKFQVSFKTWTQAWPKLDKANPNFTFGWDRRADSGLALPKLHHYLESSIELPIHSNLPNAIIRPASIAKFQEFTNSPTFGRVPKFQPCMEVRASLWGPLGDGPGSVHRWIESQYNLHLRPIKLNVKLLNLGLGLNSQCQVVLLLCGVLLYYIGG